MFLKSFEVSQILVIKISAPIQVFIKRNLKSYGARTCFFKAFLFSQVEFVCMVTQMGFHTHKFPPTRVYSQFLENIQRGFVLKAKVPISYGVYIAHRCPCELRFRLHNVLSLLNLPTYLPKSKTNT